MRYSMAPIDSAKEGGARAHRAETRVAVAGVGGACACSGVEGVLMAQCWGLEALVVPGTSAGVETDVEGIEDSDEVRGEDWPPRPRSTTRAARRRRPTSFWKVRIEILRRSPDSEERHSPPRQAHWPHPQW